MTDIVDGNDQKKPEKQNSRYGQSPALTREVKTALRLPIQPPDTAKKFLTRSFGISPAKPKKKPPE